MITRKIIQQGMGDTSGDMCPLIPFDVIVDTDVGLLRYIYNSYMDPEIFNKDFFFDKSIKQLVKELYKRKEVNPIHLCINPKYKKSCDTLYEQFIDECYEEILDLSVKTEFYRLVGLFKADSDIKVNIVCNFTMEADILSKEELTKDCNIIMRRDIKSVDKYEQFYFKKYNDINPYLKCMKAKSIYFAGYMFNFDDNGCVIDLPYEIYLLGNRISVIDIYNRSKLEEE